MPNIQQKGWVDAPSIGQHGAEYRIQGKQVRSWQIHANPIFENIVEDQLQHGNNSIIFSFAPDRYASTGNYTDYICKTYNSTCRELLSADDFPTVKYLKNSILQCVLHRNQSLRICLSCDGQELIVDLIMDQSRSLVTFGRRRERIAALDCRLGGVVVNISIYTYI